MEYLSSNAFPSKTLTYLIHISDTTFFIFSTEDGELRRTLQSLACGKARVISKEPKVGNVIN